MPVRSRTGKTAIAHGKPARTGAEPIISAFCASGDSKAHGVPGGKFPSPMWPSWMCTAQSSGSSECPEKSGLVRKIDR